MEGGLTVLAKILYLPDFHKRYKDSSAIKGIVDVQRLQQEEIIQFIQANEITHVIIGGDWYDRGFHGLGPAYGAMEMDRRLSAAVNGNVYLCVGNHFYLERDENPEMYIIQPNSYFKPSKDIPVPDTPIFKCVNDLRIGNVMISFFHYNKLDKRYVNDRPDDVSYHIGVYHDDAALPGWVAEAEGYKSAASTSQLSTIYRNVDLALHGHIHTKVGLVTYETFDGRKVPLFIPGSLSITTNKESLKHSDIKTPVICINDDSSVQVKLATFSTHLEQLRFYNTSKKKKEGTVADLTREDFDFGKVKIQSLPQFLATKGHTERSLKIVDSASKGMLNLSSAVQIITEVPNV